MGATAVIAATIVSAIGTGLQVSQQQKAGAQAKSAANEQAAAERGALADQQAKDKANLTNKSNMAGSTQQAALAAIRASMSASSSSGGTILSNPNPTGGAMAAAPTAGKTLLGV